MERSVWQTAVAATRTRASPRPGRGISRSEMSNRRGAESTAALIRSHDDRDLLDREAGDDLGPVLVHDQHLLDPDAPLVLLAVLRLEGEHHARPDLERVVERPDARDDRLVVLRQAQAVSPEVRRRLVLLVVAPRLLGRRPLERDVARGGAGADRLDRVVEPLERGGVVVLHLL